MTAFTKSFAETARESRTEVAVPIDTTKMRAGRYVLTLALKDGQREHAAARVPFIVVAR